MRKNIIKVSIFLILLLAMLYIIAKLLWVSPNNVSYFYKEPQNSLDIVCVGSSSIYKHFNTVLTYDLYGYTTYMFTSDAQPFPLVKYCLEEIEKYQNNSLYIIDLATAAENFENIQGEVTRKTTDLMKLSQNRTNAIDKMLSYNKQIEKEDYINYYFSFFMYHNKWKNLSKQNFLGNKGLYKGYYFVKGTSERAPQDEFVWNEKEIKLGEENKEVLTDLIDYIRSKNLEVLFVISKRYYDEETNGKLNEVIRIIEENNLKVINFNNIEDFNNINFATDYYNKEHLNVYGATKYTLYLAKYLKENYNLADHRGDSNYNSWSKEYERFKNDYKKSTGSNFENLIK